MNTNYCIRRAARYYGGQTAILHEDGKLTYREFAAAVEQTARRLSGMGIGKGDRVAVLMQNSPDYLDLYFSIPMTGALIVPINTRWNETEILFTLNDSGAKCLIVASDSRPCQVVYPSFTCVKCMRYGPIRQRVLRNRMKTIW